MNRKIVSVGLSCKRDAMYKQIEMLQSNNEIIRQLKDDIDLLKAEISELKNKNINKVTRTGSQLQSGYENTNSECEVSPFNSKYEYITFSKDI